jgi:hypothetical protein
MPLSGSGTVLPGQSTASLPAGSVTITIEAAPGENDGLFDAQGNPAVSENVMARCVYPDGFIKNHQTNSPQDLFGKVVNMLRNRYGVTGDITMVSLPDAVTAGSKIEVNI